MIRVPNPPIILNSTKLKVSPTNLAFPHSPFLYHSMPPSHSKQRSQWYTNSIIYLSLILSEILLVHSMTWGCGDMIWSVMYSSWNGLSVLLLSAGMDDGAQAGVDHAPSHSHFHAPGHCVSRKIEVGRGPLFFFSSSDLSISSRPS